MTNHNKTTTFTCDDKLFHPRCFLSSINELAGAYLGSNIDSDTLRERVFDMQDYEGCVWNSVTTDGYNWAAVLEFKLRVIHSVYVAFPHIRDGVLDRDVMLFTDTLYHEREISAIVLELTERIS